MFLAEPGAGAFAALVVVSLWMRGKIDEFNRSLGTESAALALYLSTLLFGGRGSSQCHRIGTA